MSIHGSCVATFFISHGTGQRTDHTLCKYGRIDKGCAVILGDFSLKLHPVSYGLALRDDGADA